MLVARRSDHEISRGSSRHSIPLRKRAVSEKSHCVSGDEVALDIERIVDC